MSFTPSCAFGPCLALGRFLDLLLAVGFIGFLDAVFLVLVADTLKFLLSPQSWQVDVSVSWRRHAQRSPPWARRFGTGHQVTGGALCPVTGRCRTWGLGTSRA